MTAFPALLLPLPVAIPLVVCAVILTTAHLLPGRLPDILAIGAAVSVAVLCAVIARYAAQGPIVYWFGGWEPHDGVYLGIGFSVDEASGWIAAFIGMLYALTFVFAWGFFDRTHGHFHILMLLFLAAMVGFSFTRDMFNLFVWFEVMSVAAFALTAYHLAESSLAGAINFTVVNSLAGFLMLGGIGLIYAQAGTLDFEGIAAAVARGGRDPVVAGAFCLVAAALMIKGAIVPFQFWLADAHAVAPSPVSVIFSGSMVSLGLFGLAKVSAVVFAGSAQVQQALPILLIGLGSFTALLGGWMALLQRHLKRMLAFSTISHAGIMLAGIGALTAGGTGGMLVYVVGHGLVKGALFMIAGILLATQASIDEIALRGLGRGIWPAGIAMALAGLLLSGLPLGALDQGTRLVQGALSQQGHGIALAATAVGAALTGAAVLRAAGRIFLGLGPDPGDEAGAPSEDEREKANRPLWLMLAPCCALLALDVAIPPELIAHALPRAAAAFMHQPAAGALVEGPAWLPWASVAAGLAGAGYGLFRNRLPKIVVQPVSATQSAPTRALEFLHSGLIGDYAAWLAVGVAGIAAVLAMV
ncbi:multisubunit sodium/proton antiporter, MrpD subunit [Methylobacterium phyllostachyos]|uniref:Multisubunit sodium/proton antiporter, MrpD subunit n=1 Tax=Methylobacterium phyllostachyos TaxID=582672 RepID=A0A1G9T6R3_9HYPH|nr:proton-conducting transporter membrane subunit [Methylobacterium phyllostachyos]SDM43328.1 multisubunit sodium/proton antiporter, MrpD subunit [Methylobacterium phyllostachyos]